MIIFLTYGERKGHFVDAQDDKWGGYYLPNGTPLEMFIRVARRDADEGPWQPQVWMLDSTDDDELPQNCGLHYSLHQGCNLGWTLDLPTAYRRALERGFEEELHVLFPGSHTVALASALTGLDDLQIEIMEGGE